LAEGKVLILFKFIGVGLLATLVHSGIFFLVINFFNIEPLTANVLAFSVAFVISYLGHRGVTFRHIKVQNERVSAIKFATSTVISFSLNFFWVYLIEYQFKLDANFSLIGIGLLTPIATFFLLKKWVFV
jgi:putative flippase GtrA